MKVQKWLSRNSIIIVAIGMFIFSSLYNNAFLTSFNIKGMLIESSFMTLLAMGMTFVILTGGIDLSVGSIAGLSSVVLTLIMKHWKLGNDLLVILIAVVLSLLLCTALGLINGIFVTKLRLPPLIVTLGMTWVASGLGNALLKGVPLALSISAYKKALEIKVLDWIPITFIIVLTLLILQAYVLKSFRWGREFYAVGSNRYAAFISGTKTSSVLRRAYMLSGLLAGLAGLLIAAYTGSGYPAAARNYELYTIAAVVMGGISLTGGEGKVFLAFFGVIVLRLLNKLVVFTGLSSISGFIEGIIVGSLLIIVLLINTLRKGEETK